jgi:hypothetical protein
MARAAVPIEIGAEDFILAMVVRMPAEVTERLASFDRATARQTERNRWFHEHHPALLEPRDRGWRREDLYDRGGAR